MKAPKYVVLTMQDAINAGLNAFAFELMAESFADNPDKFGGDNVLLRSHAHNGQDVWFVMTKTLPKIEDFERDVDTSSQCAGDLHQASGST